VTPKLSRTEIFVSIVPLLAALLLGPDKWFQTMNINWLLGLFLLPVFFGCGLLSAWLFYRKNESSAIDPFFVRSWMSLLGGLVALPICLVFRPSVADLAFIALNFGLGPILGFPHYRSIIEPTKSRRPDLSAIDTLLKKFDGNPGAPLRAIRDAAIELAAEFLVWCQASSFSNWPGGPASY
jgi:hypothetical protein